MTDDDRRDETETEPSSEPSRIEPARTAPAGGGVPWGLAGFLVLTILLVVFVLQNGQDVGLTFLGWEGSYPLAMILIVVVAVSVILDEILGAVLRRRRRRRRDERAELKRLRSQQ